MATLVCGADGNLTAAATWRTCDGVLYAVNANTALTTSYVESATFTVAAGNYDGIVVHIASRAASPSGTISVRLATAGPVLVAGTEVTINVSDIDRPGGTGLHAPGLYLFKFAAPVALAAATNYTLSAKTSVGSQVNLYRNATANNWSRMIRSTTTAAPAAADDMHTLGEFTAAATMTARSVTMDSTAATDYGSGATDLNLQGFTVGKGGSLTWGTAASTNYILRLSTGARVWAGGTWTKGSVATPIPRTSTAVLEFDCAADGDFGFLGDGTVVEQGLSRTAGADHVKCLLNTDEAAAQTVLGIDTDVKWLAGDIIEIATTSRTFSQSEQKILASDTTPTTATVTVGLANAHSGTSPTQAEVTLVTRNVITRSVSTTAMTFVLFGDTATVDIDWVWFRYVGVSTDYKNGVQIRTQSGGSCTIDFCSVTDFEQRGMYIGATNVVSNANVAVRNTVFTTRQNQTIEFAFGLSQTDGTGIVLTDLTVTAVDGSAGDRKGFVVQAAPNAVISGLHASGCEGWGTEFNTPTTGTEVLTGGTISNINAHSNQGAGLYMSGNFPIRISTVKLWRNNVNLSDGGLVIAGPGVKQVLGGQIFGNNLNNLQINQNSVFRGQGLTVASDTTFSTVDGIEFNGSAALFFSRFEGCSFGAVSGIFAAHTNDINFGGGRKTVDLTLINTPLASATEMLNTASLQGQSAIRQQRVDGTTNVHKTTYPNICTIELDTTVFHTAAPSTKISPANTQRSEKIESEPRRVPIRSGSTVTISVWVLKNGTYNGSAPRLMMRANPAIGVNADTVLATHSESVNVWQKLTATTAVASENGGCEFYVDGDGTAGAYHTDDWLGVSN